MLSMCGATLCGNMQFRRYYRTRSSTQVSSFQRAFCQHSHRCDRDQHPHRCDHALHSHMCDLDQQRVHRVHSPLRDSLGVCSVLLSVVLTTKPTSAATHAGQIAGPKCACLQLEPTHSCVHVHAGSNGAWGHGRPHERMVSSITHTWGTLRTLSWHMGWCICICGTRCQACSALP